MLPELVDLLDGFELYAARQGIASTRDERAIEAALQEAASLADADERDEPAALFYALARRPRAFGKLHGDMLALLAVGQARAVGFELSLDPVALQIHRLRIVLGQMPFAELRGWFAARLRPIQRRPWPPK
jgi:hypothetical protein